VTIYAATEAPRERAGRLADEMKSLIDAAAAGDRRAAFDLATGLRACARAYRRPDELEAAISMLRTQRKLKTADMSAPLDVISNAETELLVQRELVEPFEYCRGVERNTISRADEWLRRSAKAGYPAAVQALLPELDNSDESIALLESAWRDGRTWALEPLALRYSEGVAGRAPDLIRAYAYRLLHVRLLEAMTAAPPGPVATKVLTQARADLDALGRQLKPAQLSASTELAEELLTRNSRCCTPS
jgi:TPR repeat protein